MYLLFLEQFASTSGTPKRCLVRVVQGLHYLLHYGLYEVEEYQIMNRRKFDEPAERI